MKVKARASLAFKERNPATLLWAGSHPEQSSFAGTDYEGANKTKSKGMQPLYSVEPGTKIFCNNPRLQALGSPRIVADYHPTGTRVYLDRKIPGLPDKSVRFPGDNPHRAYRYAEAWLDELVRIADRRPISGPPAKRTVYRDDEGLRRLGSPRLIVDELPHLVEVRVYCDRPVWAAAYDKTFVGLCAKAAHEHAKAGLADLLRRAKGIERAKRWRRGAGR